MHQINHGPFAGVSFSPDETFRVNPALPDERPRTGAILAVATQKFLSKFDPREGWGVRIQKEVMAFDMVPRNRDGLMGDTPAPCVRFDASLVNPGGSIVAQASTVWIISGPTEWEKGESNVRQRLYEAVGLQTRFEEPGDSEDGHTGDTAKVVHLRQEAPAVPVTFEPVVQTEAEQGEAEAADAMLGQPSEVSVASSDQTATPQPPVEQQASASGAQPEQGAGTTADVGSSTETDRPTRAKRTRERLPDDAPAPKALMDQCRRIAAMRNETLPDEQMTKAQANAFLKQLQGG